MMNMNLNIYLIVMVKQIINDKIFKKIVTFQLEILYICKVGRRVFALRGFWPSVVIFVNIFYSV